MKLLFHDNYYAQIWASGHFRIRANSATFFWIWGERAGKEYAIAGPVAL
jgi:hypothetical protein